LIDLDSGLDSSLLTIVTSGISVMSKKCQNLKCQSLRQSGYTNSGVEYLKFNDPFFMADGWDAPL